MIPYYDRGEDLKKELMHDLYLKLTRPIDEKADKEFREICKRMWDRDNFSEVPDGEK